METQNDKNDHLTIKSVIVTVIVLIFIVVAIEISATNTNNSATVTTSPSVVQNTNNQTAPPAYIPTVQDQNASCKDTAEIKQYRTLISSCYLEGKLTSECKTSFDKNGNYLDTSQQGAEELQSYLTTVNACLANCYLPSSITSEVSTTEKQDEDQCDQLYPLNQATPGQ